MGSKNVEENAFNVLLHGLHTSEQVVDHNDSRIHVAPSEAYSLLNMFADAHSEELSFPLLFFGAPRFYHAEAQKSYQTIAQWGWR